MALLRYELKKLLNHNYIFGVLFLSIVILIALFYMFFFVGEISGYSDDPVHGHEAVLITRDIAKQHSGKLTDKAIIKIFEDYAQNEPALKEKGVYDTFSRRVIEQFIKTPDPTNAFIAIHQSNIPLSFDNVTIKNQIEVSSSFPLEQLYLGNFPTWNQLFNILNNSFLLACCLSIFICSGIFSNERNIKMDRILFTTPLGRTKLVTTKLVAVSLVSTSLFIIIQSIILVVFSFYFGWSGWNTSVQLNLYWITPFSNIMAFPIHLNLSTALLYTLIYQLSGLLLLISLICFISSLVRTPLLSFTATLIILFLPKFLLNLFYYDIFGKFLIIFLIPIDDIGELLMRFSSNLKNGLLLNSFYLNVVSVFALRSLTTALLFLATYHKIRKQNA